MSTFRAEQAALPTPPARVEPEEIEGVKFETTAKGPRWTIRVHKGASSDPDMVERIAQIDHLLRDKFGDPT